MKVPKAAKRPSLMTLAEIDLVPSVVAFVDVLGTKAMASNQVEELQRLVAARARAESFADESPSYQTVTFTDNTVLRWRSAGLPEESVSRSLAWVADELAAFQLAFAINGMFLRGAVESGLLAIGPGYVFGDALTNAYLAETKAAVWPRIILSESVVEQLAIATDLASDGSEEFPSSVLIDEDGIAFVHYLGWAERSGDPAFYLRQHKVWLLARLAEQRGNAQVVEKLRWSIDYHNHSIRSGSHPDSLQIGDEERGRAFSSLLPAPG